MSLPERKPGDRDAASPGENAAPDDDSPGVPGFRTWRGVYWFVFGCFVLVVVLLTWFSRAYT